MPARKQARRHRGRNRMVPRTPRTIRPQQVGNPATDPTATIAYWVGRLGDPLFVYFIQSGENGPVKIGQALNPIKRMAELQCGNPQPLLLRAVVLASLDLEDRLHSLWRPCCIGGEWFAGDSENLIIDMARQTMAAQIGTPQEDLYLVSSSLVETSVHPARIAA